VNVLGTVLVWLGVAVTVGSAVAAVALRPVYPRLHALTPVTVLAGPLVGVGLILRTGWTLTAATLLVITVLLAITGPALGAVTARLAAERNRAGEPDG
jgi:multicomponent Na+:H+ antiporter subunit G